MKLDVKVDTRGVLLRLDARQREVRQAAAITINRLLPEMQQAVIGEMARTFDRPTPYTLGGTFVRKATPTRIEGVVALKDEGFAGKGVPATKYLAPSVFGGDRNEKRFERALRAAGILPIGMYAVKGEGAQTDAFGNMARGQIVQILSYFQAFSEQGFRANSTEKSRARLKRGTRKSVRGFTYFVLRSSRGKLPPGIYQSIKSGFGYAIKPVLIFVDGAPNYERAFDFYGVAEKVARRRFPDVYASTLRKMAGVR
ncbi:MAG: hypothetical protein O9345_16110 [Burkholderiaceae bacterium]|nr:hypothetical protein [Burkholderiaceae bacterium]